MNIIFLIIAILALLLYVLNLSYKKTVQKLLESQHAEDDKDGRQTEPYQFQTNQIKYEMYDVKYLSNDNLKKIYQKVIIKNLWNNEPFYSLFFKILLAVDKNDLYIIDPHTKVITSHLRDENDQMMIIKSFQVLKTENVLALAIMSAIKEIVNFRDIEEAQSLLLALCIMVIQKSKYFSLYEQSDLIQFFLFGYDHVKNVEAILESLERDDYEYSFLQRALKGAIKSAKRYPYVNKGEESVSFERVSLPPKVLQHF